LHKNSETSKKKPKGGALTVEEKAENCRRRFGLRMSLICSIINFALGL